MASAAVITATIERTHGKRHAVEVHLSFPALKQVSVKDTPCSDPPCKLRSGLLIGSLVTESSLSALRAAGITHILQAGAELVPSHPGKFVYKNVSICDVDDEDLVAIFKEAFDFIDEGRKTGAVLVHCAQGVSRSASILTAYLMKHCRFSFDTALSHVQSARPTADPNHGFTLQLQEFERLGCDIESWPGWDKQRLDRCFRSSCRSGRRAVHGMADLIRRFHVHDLCDDSTVFDDSTVML